MIGHRRLSRAAITATLLLALAACSSLPSARADQILKGWEASNMHPIGYSDLAGHGGAFKMSIKHVNNHWYLYLGHLWNSGWSIVDVTDPTNPKVVKFIPWSNSNTMTGQMEIHGNIMLTSLERPVPGWGGNPEGPHDEGVLIWDISDPLNPKILSHWKTGTVGGTHRDWYPGGRYAYLSAGKKGFKGNILDILDISDPVHPKEVGHWALPGQEGEDPNALPNSPAAHKYMFHGPPIIDGNRAYLGHGPAILVMDISDMANWKIIGRLDISPPFSDTAGIPAHDVLPIPGKNLLFAHSEASGGDKPDTYGCTSGLPFTGLIDIKDPAKPRLVSVFPLPVPPKDVPYRDFCDKGGRFGPHNTNLEQHNPDVEKQGDKIVYLTYFNAGLRIFNIEDPRMPKEAGWFIPPTPTKRLGPIPWKLVNQTEVVLVDTRGNIYIDDKQWGLFILRYDGQGEPAPTAK